MPMREWMLYSGLYVMHSLYLCAAAYILIFTARPDCVTFSDYVSSFLENPDSVYIFTGLGISFVLSIIAAIALLKIPMGNNNFKYLLLYLWAVSIAASVYWQDVNILLILAAGLVSYEYYKKIQQSNI